MNSVSPAMRASENLSGNAIQKIQSSNSSHTHAITPIEIHKMSCHLSHAHNLLYNLCKTFSSFWDFLAKEAIDTMTARFSSEKNIAITSTSDACIKAEKKLDSTLTINVPASPIDVVHRLIN